MRHAAWLMVLGVAALAGSALAEDKKETNVDLDGLKSKAPANWVKEKPASTMRFLQFMVPRAEGDKEDAEVQLFQDAGGTVKDNLARWKNSFAPPEGKEIDDVAKVSEITIGGIKATMLDIHGTFKSPQFDPKFKGAKKENFRLVAIQFKGPDHLYHIKLIGPSKTVEAAKKGFDEWLKNFKKSE